MAEADNGRAALDWLAGQSAAGLILLDLMMPEMDGFEFLRTIREPSRAWRDIPVVVVTAEGPRPRTSATRLDADAQRVLQKGATAADLGPDRRAARRRSSAARHRDGGRPADG